jgi:plastocyanin
MRQLRIGAGLMLFALLAAPAARSQMMEQVVPGEVRVFQVTLRHKGAAPGFTPFLVIVRPQDKVRFVVTSMDSDCSFELKGLHIEQKLKKGVPTTINFSVPDEGKFDYICAHGVKHRMHRDIKGTLVVKQGNNGGAEAASYGAGTQ